MNTADIKILDIRPDVGGFGSGETILFELNGAEFQYESWSTDDSSGTDFYRKGGKPLDPPWSQDDEEEMAEFFDEVLTIYADWWKKVVVPTIEVAARETIAQVERDR